jgi:hypothetical protein
MAKLLLTKSELSLRPPVVKNFKPLTTADLEINTTALLSNSYDIRANTQRCQIHSVTKEYP